MGRVADKAMEWWWRKEEEEGNGESEETSGDIDAVAPDDGREAWDGTGPISGFH
jgi:hypothetical protein